MSASKVGSPDTHPHDRSKTSRQTFSRRVHAASRRSVASQRGAKNARQVPHQAPPHSHSQSEKPQGRRPGLSREVTCRSRERHRREGPQTRGSQRGEQRRSGIVRWPAASDSASRSERAEGEKTSREASGKNGACVERQRDNKFARPKQARHQAANAGSFA